MGDDMGDEYEYEEEEEESEALDGIEVLQLTRQFMGGDESAGERLLIYT
jgi:hypothetical protein